MGMNLFMTNSTNTFKHSGGMGDMILGLPTVMELGGGTFYLHTSQFAKMGSLLAAQPYLKVEELPFAQWKEKQVTHNLDLFRTISKVSIAEMHAGAFNVKPDFSRPWLFNIPPKRVAKIVIHDTGSQRFPGYTVDWNLLKGYEKDCVFIGYDCDYLIFQRDRKLDISWYKTADLYEVAQVIKGCDLFIGNSSSPYTIAEGLKKPLVIDLYVGRPQYPLSTSGFVNLSQHVLEKFVK